MPKLDSVTTKRQSVTVNDKSSDSQREILCWAISELEKKLKENVDIRQKPNAPLQNRLIKLIGEKPLFHCSLGGIDSRVLWDTGSMISMVSSAWVKENIPNAKLQPISDFLEDEQHFEFKAANDTDVPMEGCIVLDFVLGKSVFPVPFLVSSSPLSNPIVGFNVMVHLIISGKQTREELIDSLITSYQGKAAGKMNVMVNLVEKNVMEDDFLGDLLAVRNSVIPAKSSARI